MRSSVEPLEGNRVRLSVEVDETEFDRDIDQAFRKLAQQVRLPGFRPGKAPRRLLEAHFGQGPAREQALRDAIPSYLAQAVREHAVDIIAAPEVDITAGEDDGPVAFNALIEVRPEVIVPGYAGLRVELPSPTVSDDDVDELVEAELRRHGDLRDVERPVRVGDQVTLDITAERDGEPVPGLTTEDWLYEVGRGWVADGFDDELLEAVAGDELRFSRPPRGTDEPADFVVLVKSVQELVAPEATDEWVVEHLAEWDGVDEWRGSIRERMEAVRLGQARQVLVERTTEALAELVDEDPPDSLVGNEVQSRLEGLARNLAAQGIGLEQYLAAIGQDPASFSEGLKAEATRSVKADLALRAVAEAEGLEASDDEVEQEIARIAQRVGQKPARVRKAYERNEALASLRAEIRKAKALEWLIRRVEVVDPDGNALDRALLIPDDEVAVAADPAPTDADLATAAETGADAPLPETEHA